MRLLFLGTSDTFGAGLQRAEDAYPYLVLRALQETWPDQAHDVAVHPLVPTPTAPDYAEKILRQTGADVVVLEINQYFVVTTVDTRVRRLSPRLYPYYARLRDALARLLASPNRPRFTHRLYAELRFLLGRTLGVQPPIPPETAAENYNAALRRLAALESPDLIVISSGLLHSEIERQHPGTRANVIRLNDLVRAYAERTNIPFIDKVRAYAAVSENSLYTEDGMHGTAVSQRLRADLILSHLLALGPSPAANMTSAR